jgi:hypothetical protein
LMKYKQNHLFFAKQKIPRKGRSGVQEVTGDQEPAI